MKREKAGKFAKEFDEDRILCGYSRLTGKDRAFVTEIARDLTPESGPGRAQLYNSAHLLEALYG
jgi:hypothetical protein